MTLVEEPPATRAPGRRRRQVLTGTAVLVAAGCATAGLAALWQHDGKHEVQVPTLPTADVTRTDLAEQTQADGTLGYVHTYTLLGAGSGHLTWLPTQGDTMRRGQRVYGVDNRPVPLFYGSTPLWRPLRQGVSDGEDVRELKRNLAALGYDDGGAMTIDDHFGAATAQAVEDWQSDRGVTTTGQVSPGDLAIEPGPIRISNVSANLSAPVGGGPLMTATDTARQVTVNLPVNEEEIAAEGAQVGIQLPGGKTTTGHISSIGTVASVGSNGSGGQGQTGQGTQTATIPVSIDFDHPEAAGRFDGAPVTVTFSSGTHKAVLAVPVSALLANPDGSYSVRVVSGGQRRRVPVTLGIFSGGQVEVSGPGLTEGMKVEVPRS